ncbi:MAG: L,D-transpeptidase family protein [Verrucomicrobium sp.]
MLTPTPPSSARRNRRFIQPLLAATVATAWMLIGASCATGPAGGTTARPADMGEADGVKLQVFLDSQSFGPGIVDGREGEFTKKALARYNAAHGLAADAFPNLRSIEPYTTYTISAEDRSKLGSQAGSPAEVALQKSQPYTSLTELLAERFHTSKAFVAKLNPGKNVDSLPAGESVTVPNVARPLYVTEIPTTSATARVQNPALAGRSIRVFLRERMLEVQEGGQVLAAFPITPGSSEHPAPAGEWKIVGITTFPWYRWDQGVLQRGERTEDFYNLPPGPNSSVGVVWMGLNRPGVGIHGTSTPETIGRSGSHGCIRLANWDAAVVRQMVTAGSKVVIE